MPISPARKAAFDILLKVAAGREHSSALLEQRASALEANDRSLCHEITLGTLRNQIFLDRLIKLYSSKDPSSLDPEILICLRIGLYQIRFLDRVPAFAVVNDSVSLAVRARKRSAKGFVNAILRRALREPAEPEYSSREDEVCARYSHPVWLFERWMDAFGEESAAQLLEMNNRPRPAAFRLTKKYDSLNEEARKRVMEDVTAAAEGIERVPGAFRVTGSSATVRELVENGLAYFQDESSQLVAAAVRLSGGMNMLDLCAAPGSKSSLLARAHDPEDGLFVASDLRQGRIKVLREVIDRQGAEFVKIVRLDAESELPFKSEFFDRILVDAPCTGTGTISANPEIRYRIGPKDISDLSVKQRKILGNASKALKKGGRLIYSTCSLEREENEDVVDDFLANNPDFQPADPGIDFGETGANRAVRLLPHKHGTEGFFIAALERVR